MEKHFLQNYEVHKKPEAIAAAEKKERLTGEENLANDSNERITAYVERLANVFLHPDKRTRERNIAILKPTLYNNVVIKPEKFPESYWAYQQQLIEERGGGYVEFSPEQKATEMQNIIHNQQTSLDNWIDYLSSSDNPYAPDIKLFVMQGVLKLGKFNTDKYSFARRRVGDSTVAPFPEIDREALAKVMGAMKWAHQGGDDHEYSDAIKTMAKQGAAFGKMYAKAMQELDASTEGKQWEITDGEWRHFEQGSDPAVMQRTLEGKRSNLCIGSGQAHAASYLQAGDMHIYYSKDRSGQPTVPRAAIAMRDGTPFEVRGTYNTNEDLDPFIVDTVDAKLHTFPGGESYNKKSADMRLLTAIKNKTKESQPLTKSDLTFLYELDSTIEGFGYQKDPRIAELRATRNPEEDMLIVFECTKDQIAHTPQEINETTKAYLGTLTNGLFDKIQEYNIEHIYTSFPEGKIKKMTVEIGGKTPQQLIQEMKDKHIEVSPYAEDMLKNKDFTTLPSPEQTTLIRLQVKDLGIPKDYPTTEEIYTRIEELGLELCPAETGPHLRLQDSTSDFLHIAMEQISDRGGNPRVFRLDCPGDDLWLLGRWAKPADEWAPHSAVVFRLRPPKAGRQV